jgi:hypothetical protein
MEKLLSGCNAMANSAFLMASLRTNFEPQELRTPDTAFGSD